MIKFVKRYWLTACVFLGMFLTYKYIADNRLVNALLFPPVEEIKESFIENSSLFWINMLYSFRLLIPAIIIMVILALVIGVALGMNQRLRDALHPVLYTISVVPSILLSPFALMLAPNFWVASLFLIVYGSMWSTVFGTITGIMTIDKRYLDNAATLELTGFERFFRIILPAASPSIFSGFINSLSASFVMLVYSEMYGAKYGMGFFVKKYSEYGMYNHTWSGFLFMVIVLVSVMQIFDRWKEHVLKWTIN